MATFTFDTDWGLPVLSIIVGLTIALIGYFGRKDKTDTMHETRIGYMERRLEQVEKKIEKLYDIIMNSSSNRGRNKKNYDNEEN